MAANHSRFVTTTKPTDHQSREFAVIILSSHFNYRMKSFGPKALIPVRNKPLVLHQIDTIRSVYPRAEIYLVVGFEADRVIKAVPAHVRIVENQREETNEMEELRLALNNCPSQHILIINGDVLFNSRAISDVCQNNSSVLIDIHNALPKTEIGVTVSQGKATIMHFAVKEQKWCQSIFLTGNELTEFRQICSNRNLSNHFFFEGVNTLLDRTGGINVFEPPPLSISRLISNKEVAQADEDSN